MLHQDIGVVFLETVPLNMVFLPLHDLKNIAKVTLRNHYQCISSGNIIVNAGTGRGPEEHFAQECPRMHQYFFRSELSKCLPYQMQKQIKTNKNNPSTASEEGQIKKKSWTRKKKIGPEKKKSSRFFCILWKTYFLEIQFHGKRFLEFRILCKFLFHEKHTFLEFSQMENVSWN